MTQGPHITHYSYHCGPNGLRELVASYNLDQASPDRRRATIHKLLENGQLLAACPWGVRIQSLSDLRNAIDWLHNDGKMP